MPVSPSTFRAHRPVGLVVISVLELLEAAVLVVLAALGIAAGPSSPYPATAYGVGGTLLLAAALLVLVAVGTLGARLWARSSGLVWQIVQILVAVVRECRRGAGGVRQGEVGCLITGQEAYSRVRHEVDPLVSANLAPRSLCGRAHL